MAKSSSSTAAPSQRSKKPSSSILAEGVTPRPRRRKQPTIITSTNKGVNQHQSNTINHDSTDDGDYSFLAEDNDTSVTDSRGKQRGSTGREKENEMNRQKRDDSKQRDKRITLQNNDDTAKKRGSNVDELSEAMAMVTLSDNGNKNNWTKREDTTEIMALQSSSEAAVLKYACPPVGYGTNKLSISSNNTHLRTTLQNSIQTLENQGDNNIVDTTTSCKVLSKNTTLLEMVASSSHSLKSAQSILIEENTTKLVDVAKKCLKALTLLTDDKSTKKKNKPSVEEEELTLALLRVAVHTLRSITPTLDYNESKSTFEIVIKLFYHCVVIAGDACHKKFQSFGDLTKKKGGGVTMVLEYSLLCLGSYEGLGRLLLQGNNSSNGSKTKKTRKDEISWDEMLPIPKMGENSKSFGPLPQKQLVKIALESSQCAASSLLYLSLVSLHISAGKSKEEYMLPDEFHFGSSVIYETCSGKLDGMPMFQKILTNVTLSYILQSLLEAKGAGNTMTIANIDALRQVKKVYRILWDGARSIEEVGNASNSTTLRICSLNLYCEAIVFILEVLHQCFELCPNSSNLSDAERSDVHALFDRAASSAMKAAAVFDKSSGVFAPSSKGKIQSASLAKNKKALLQCHNFIGAKLDLTRRCIYLGGGGSPLSASYFEYCTYRSVHIFRLTGSCVMPSFSLNNEVKAMSKEDADCLLAMWTFFVVDLSLQARYGLMNDDAVLTMPEKEIEFIINTFEKRISSASSTIQSRSRSMILLAELHKEATKILSSTSNQTYTSKGAFLALIGSILERCLAPLELNLSRSQKEASRSLNFRFSSSDIHAKSALFYTIASEVSNEEEKKRFACASDSQLQKSFDILMKIIGSIDDDAIESNTQCITAVEMFAKIATQIGKKRTSMQAQLFAVEILSKISIKAASVEMFDKYQICNRYMMLSSIMESSGQMKEAIATMAVALWSVVEEMKISAEKSMSDDEAAVGDPIAEHVLLFPATYASSLESSETVFSSILSKLTRSYIDLRQSSSQASKNQDEYLSKCLGKTLIGKLLDVASSSSKEGKELNLSKLLHYAIWNQKRYEVLSSPQLAEIVRSVLLSITKVVKRCVSRENDSTDPDASHLIEEAKTFLQAQKKRVGDVTDRDVHQVMSSSFHAYFAAILMESKFVEYPRPSMWVQYKGIDVPEQILLKHSYSQLQHAENLFREDSTNDESITDACFFAQWTAIQFLQAVLMEHLCLGKMSSDVPNNGSRSFIRYNNSAVEKYRTSLGTCCRAVDIFDEELFPEVVESLLITLEGLLYRFCFLGDTIASAETFSLLQQVCSSLSGSTRVMKSISAFVLASSTLEYSMPLFIDSTQFRQNVEANSLDEDEEDDSDLDSIRCVLSAIRSFLRAHDKMPAISFKVDSVMELSNHVSEQAERVTTEGLDTDEVMMIVQMQAIVGRLHFIIAKMLLGKGKPATALQSLCSCRQECKRQLNLLRAIGRCHDIPLGSAVEQTDDLLSLCYEDLACAFASMGIRRKAEDYAVLAVLKRRILNFDECQRVSGVSVQELVDLGSDLDGLDGVLRSLRTILRMKYLSSPPDKMALEPLEFKSSLLPKIESSDAAHIHQFTCRSKTLLSYNDSLQNISSFRPKVQAYLDRACQGHEALQESENEYGLLPLVATQAELKLRKFRNEDNKKLAYSLLTDVVDASNVPADCTAQAQYECGLIALENARLHGELRSLWHGYFVSNGEAGGDGENPPLQHTLEARKHFQGALNQAGPSATKFTKDILRCLALTTGPEDTDSTSFLIHASIGGNTRSTLLDIFSDPSQDNTFYGLRDNVKSLFQMFDDEKLDCTERIKSFQALLQESAALLPESWTISSVAICPTGEMLVSTMRKVATKEGNAIRTSNLCIMHDDPEHNAHSDLLIPLDQIIDRSQRQLHGITEEAQTEQYDEESVRRKWWNERHKINDDLRSLLEYAEVEYFGHDLVKEALVSTKCEQSSGDGDDDSSACSDYGPSPARLATRFEQVEIEESDTTSLKKLTVAVLKERLKSLGVASSVFQKMRKAELIELLTAEMERGDDNDAIMEDAQEMTPDLTCVERESSQEKCTILILDEHLQRFPFESMDMFTGQAVTRVPSLPFVLATLMESESLSVDPDRLSFVLDPESNLSETASNLGPALNNLASSRGSEWNGVIGEMPSPEFMTEILKSEHEMFLYCGHGGGEKFFSRSQVVEVMTSRDDGIRGCRAPVVLMGCSSGKLQSVNCPKENSTDQAYPVYYEPEGIALSYLIAGSPCVVGNLWDVTDRDIDRYCLTLMEDFLQGQGDSLAKCVAGARRACKLRYIVGSAPICYGLPLKCSSR